MESRYHLSGTWVNVPANWVTCYLWIVFRFPAKIMTSCTPAMSAGPFSASTIDSWWIFISLLITAPLTTTSICGGSWPVFRSRISASNENICLSAAHCKVIFEFFFSGGSADMRVLVIVNHPPFQQETAWTLCTQRGLQGALSWLGQWDDENETAPEQLLRSGSSTWSILNNWQIISLSNQRSGSANTETLEAFPKSAHDVFNVESVCNSNSLHRNQCPQIFGFGSGL